MSGDVQPRKRKDKKRRKDDSIDQPVPPPQPHVAPKENGDDVNIHVHKEAGTGGNICSKIVFFLLFSALTVLIGLIILEHRGLTDLEASDGESRYAHIFEGWIDTSHDDHDDHNIEAAIDEHEEEHDLGDEHDLEEDEHNSEQDEHDLEDDEHGSEEDEHDLEDDDEVDHDEDDEEKEENEENESEENLSEQEEDDDINKYETQEVDDDDDQNEDIDEDEDEDEDDQTNENEVSDEDNALENDDEEEEDNASPEVLSKEVDDFDDDDQKDDDDQDDISKEEDNDDDDVEPVKRDLEENDDNDENEDENEEESNGTSGSSMIVKLGVGVALLVVAHFVLVRKWKSAQEDAPIAVDKEPTPDLSRRNTIIPPPTLQEVEQDIENDDEEYSEDEDYSEEEFRVEPKSAKAKYQELRSTYSRSLTPDIDSEVRRKPKPDEFEYEDEESVEEEEEGEDEEEYDEEDDEEGVEEESESEEDEEVLKRLETKYGNIRKGRPAKKQEQGRLSSWKHVKMPEGNAEESEDSDRQSEDGAGYGTGYEHSAVTNKDDWEIRDKIDEAQGAIKKE